MSLLALDRMEVTLGGRAVVTGASLTVAAGELVGLVGPNGAGKTTLLRGALGLARATGSSLAAMGPGDRARHVAFLPQAREIAWPVSVAALVALGRMAHPTDARRDAAAVAAALGRMGLGAFANRDATQLSGGEQARVLIARALAQETPLVLADEPVAGLDPAGQIGVMDVFRELAREGRGLLVSLHDLGLAARLCDRVVAMAGGRIVADGPPRDVLTPALLAEVFGVRAYFADTPDGPVLVPIAATSSGMASRKR